MKRLAILTTSLLLTLSAAGGAVSALAAGDETAYPDGEGFYKILEFSSLDDYGMEEDVYYFANGETLYTFVNGRLSSAPLEETEYEFPLSETTVTVDDSYTFRLADSTLKVWDSDDKVTAFDGEYSNLKKLGGTAYAVKENVLYRLDGANPPEAVLLKYVDYAATQTIKTGNAAEALKNYESLKFVTVKAGAFMTAIDLTALDGEYFTLENTEDDVSVNTVAFSEDKTALLLCYTGNAAIVSIGDTSYLLLNDESALEEITVDCVKEAELTNATIVGNRIYASPFTVIGTTALPNAAGTIVTVKHKLEYEGVLNSVYYEVEYTEDETVKTGYVAAGFLTEYIIEDNKEPEVIPDPEHSEKTSVTTVLLILAVVVLVLIAFGYIVFTATSDKKKKGKKGKDGEDEEEEKEEK